MPALFASFFAFIRHCRLHAPCQLRACSAPILAHFAAPPGARSPPPPAPVRASFSPPGTTTPHTGTVATATVAAAAVCRLFSLLLRPPRRAGRHRWAVGHAGHPGRGDRDGAPPPCRRRQPARRFFVFLCVTGRRGERRGGERGGVGCACVVCRVPRLVSQSVFFMHASSERSWQSGRNARGRGHSPAPQSSPSHARGGPSLAGRRTQQSSPAPPHPSPPTRSRPAGSASVGPYGPARPSLGGRAPSRARSPAASSRLARPRARSACTT